MRGSRRVLCPGFPEEQTFPALARAGWAVLSIDYRLSSEAVFPAQRDDVVAAIEWLREEGCARHRLDPDRIVLWGESAGAHLAALAALIRPSLVSAVVDWYGPSDLGLLLADIDPSSEPTREQALLGGPGRFSPDLVQAASPLFAVHADAPPFLIAHGLSDDLVPPVHSELLAAALREAGAVVELQLIPDAGHLWRGLDDLSSVLPRALEFLRRHVDNPRSSSTEDR